ncbi:hypothetical protein [Streptomyces sp. NBC_01465]|uniref:hypothetical protein n=1 Tax=Streptomyces sp. NBC_01465 TaxID=2903878 RepID=UPI002E2FBEE8|nr:hypothetical protein [Streptomyces sp. NBC_01465]
MATPTLTPAPGARRAAAAVRPTAPLLVLLLFLCFQAAVASHWAYSNDSYRYTRSTLEFLGEPPAEARAQARAVYCAEHPAPCPATIAPDSPAYERIFTTRPGYPLLAAPAVALLGVVPGLWTTALVLTAAAGLLAYGLLREAGAGVWTAAGGQALLVFGAPGNWAMRPLTEGLVLVAVLACVLGAYRILEGRRPGAAWLLTGFAVLCAAKYSTALLFAGALGAVCLVRWALVREDRAARGLGLAAAGAAGALAVVCRLLGLPGAGHAAQEVLTEHFTRPEVAEPWLRMAPLVAQYWLTWGRGQSAFAALLAVSAVALWRLHPRLALPALAAAATGAATASALPRPDELDRLWLLMWVPVVLGAPLLAALLSRTRQDPVQPSYPSGSLLCTERPAPAGATVPEPGRFAH